MKKNDLPPKNDNSTGSRTPPGKPPQTTPPGKAPPHYTAIANCTTSEKHSVLAYRIDGDCNKNKYEKWIYYIDGANNDFRKGNFTSFCNSYGRAATHTGIKMNIKWFSYKKSLWTSTDRRYSYLTVCR